MYGRMTKALSGTNCREKSKNIGIAENTIPNS